eukprot:144053-Hanusia_phi.AAC.2
MLSEEEEEEEEDRERDKEKDEEGDSEDDEDREEDRGKEEGREEDREWRQVGRRRIGCRRVQEHGTGGEQDGEGRKTSFLTTRNQREGEET